MKNWNVRKAVVAREDMPEEHRLKQSLSWPHLVALGVGAIVGTGILTLIGVGAGKAGPAVILSFAIAGAICACAALAYAEVATMIPASGSAYTYSYVVFGELIAWMIGVALILEYTLVVSAVAVGWSGYAAGFLNSIGLGLPAALIQGPELGGVLNLPAIFIIWVVAGLLIAGTRESATVNAILVLIKLAALAMFIAVALPVFHAVALPPVHAVRFSAQRAAGQRGRRDGRRGDHLLRFLRLRRDRHRCRGSQEPEPRSCHRHRRLDGLVRCDLHGRRRRRDRRRGHTGFASSAEPLALILRDIGQPWAARVLGASAVVALPTVILAFFYGQSRIFFTVARDGLLPSSLARVSKRGTPVRITIFTAIVTSVFAGLIPLTAIAALANAGTLAAFIAVCAAMLVLRRREPERERKFRAPAASLVATVGILGCLYLFISLPNRTQIFFVTAQVIGLILYVIYGSRAAERARAKARA